MPETSKVELRWVVNGDSSVICSPTWRLRLRASDELYLPIIKTEALVNDFELRFGRLR